MPGRRRRRAALTDAAQHAGQVVTVRFTRANCVVHRHDDGGVRLLAEAPDLRDLRWA
ncbi:hypothetical protein ABZU53_20275 [Micromonospora sp. NPDC005194]|uniref:hypothetical protein n=1 Tax=Micromonospora sp. NPDC005194 TaxID=3156870 RepID=UPI0033B291E2